MKSMPTTETVTLSDDLQTINRKSDDAVIGYRLKVIDEDGDFCPSLSCWATVGFPVRYPNPMFEKLKSMEDKLKTGAKVHGLVWSTYFNSKRKSVELELIEVGQVTERVHQS